MLIGQRLVEPDAEAKVPHLPLREGQQLVASCGASKGYSYFPRIGMVSEEESGFTEDTIRDGHFYVVKGADDSYDLIFKDASRERHSAVGEGAVVQKLRGGRSDSAFAVFYLSGARSVELYTFYKEDDGKLRFTNLVSKGGDALIAKSGILVGPCEHLAIEL
ncbi:MAG TPA: hypothetical protein VM346_10390 [Sphingomicrobium sp.]|nr:hypothetical protein [Sphingomicrobium sp.]